MMTYTFKTNINCGGCVATVTPFLDKSEIENWKVDTHSKDKILTVESNQLDQEGIMKLVAEAGFKIEPVKKGIFGLFGRK
ncbi:MAG: heavy-metal-associated domain-containing protein [Bacteroidota bacterium]